MQAAILSSISIGHGVDTQLVGPASMDSGVGVATKRRRLEVGHVRTEPLALPLPQLHQQQHSAAVASINPIGGVNAASNCFKEKKLKLNRSVATGATSSAAAGNGPASAATKRKLSNENEQQQQQPPAPHAVAVPPGPVSDGDYRITVGEELKSASHAYRVLSYLGRGTFGQVVKAWNVNSNELVAVKILKNHPSYARQGGIEAEILQRLCREDTEACNIVRAFECFAHRSHLCLAFELLDQNLYDYLKAQKFRPLALKEIRPIAQQVLAALSKLKSLGLIHADLKPENIMLVNPGESSWRRYRVKVIDFGSACYTHKAVTSTYLQSRYYRAPEILLGLPFNESIDIWSLGCVLAELYMGWPLYPGSSEYDQIRYIVETQGYPAAGLLKVARKTGCFFNRHPYSYAYQLKPAEQYLAETGVRSKEVRKYRLSSLDQLAFDPAGPNSSTTSSTLLDSIEASSLEAELERSDRLQFCSLVKRLLRLEAKTRLDPDSALAQPFITMLHLQRSPNSRLATESRTLMRVCHQQPQRLGAHHQHQHQLPQPPQQLTPTSDSLAPSSLHPHSLPLPPPLAPSAHPASSAMPVQLHHQQQLFQHHSLHHHQPPQQHRYHYAYQLHLFV